MNSMNLDHRRAMFAIALSTMLPQWTIGQQPTSIDAITKVWQDRQDRLKTVQIKLEGDQFLAKGGLSRVLPPILLKEMGEGQFPPQDRRFATTQSFLIAGGKYRDEIQGHVIWSVADKGFITQDWQTTFDGQDRKSKITNSSRSYQQGSIQEQQRPHDADLIALYPILMAFRPVHKTLRCFDLQDFSLTGSSALIGGQMCIELTKRMAAQKLVISIWLNPAQDFLVTRMRYQEDGALRHQIDIKYQQHRDAGWVPEFWRISNNDGTGKLVKSDEERLTACVVNEELGDRVFDIEFDSRTYVLDLKRNERFVLKDDGTKRKVDKDEYGKTFKELVATDSAESKRYKSSGIIGVSLAVFLISVTILAYRWRTRRAAQRSDA